MTWDRRSRRRYKLLVIWSGHHRASHSLQVCGHLLLPQITSPNVGTVAYINTGVRACATDGWLRGCAEHVVVRRMYGCSTGLRSDSWSGCSDLLSSTGDLCSHASAFKQAIGEWGTVPSTGLKTSCWGSGRLAQHVLRQFLRSLRVYASSRPAT
jgi:hypothetical protein